MKKIFLYFIAHAVLGLSLAGCNKYLDTLPDSRMEVDTPDKVALLLTSAYPLGLPSLLMEDSSDNVMDNGVNYGTRYEMEREAYLFLDHTTTRNDTPHHVWEASYKGITAANTALESIAKLEAQGHDMSAHRAEALMVRAFCHFLLANVFCQAYNPESSATDLGIPYVDKRIGDVFAKRDRGTVKDTWDRINDDIEAALPHIDDGLYSVPKNHFNRKAALCFAAEFNLYYGNYDKAIEYASEVLGSNPAALMRNMSDTDADGIRKQSTQQAVLEVYTNPAAECNLMLLTTASSWGRVNNSSSYPRYMHNKSIMAKGTLTSPGPWSGKTGEIYATTAFPLVMYWTSGDIWACYPKMRYYYEAMSEDVWNYYIVWVPFTIEKALLVRAEAYAMKDRYDKAADDLILWYNGRMKTRLDLSADEIIQYYRGYDFTPVGGGDPIYQGAVLGSTKFELNPRHPLSEGDQTDMIMAILHARRIEFIHEGWRLVDLKRFGIAYSHNVDRGETIQIEPWDKRLAIQLPFMVIAAGTTPNPR